MIAKPKKISVVIVTWNNEKTIQLCIDSLLRQTGVDLEIQIFDNASSDKTISIINNFPNIHLVVSQQNQGFCIPNNLGIKQANGEYILLINPDARLTDGYLETLIQKTESNKDVAAITGKILRMSSDGTPELINGLPIIDTVGIKLKRNRRAIDIGRGEIDRGQYEQERWVFGISAAICLYRKEALLHATIGEQIFDETYFVYFEDVDLSWRLGLLGWRCLYTPETIAFHARGWRESFDNRRRVPEFIRYHSFKNKRLTILKNEHLNTFLPDLLHVVGLETLAFGYILLKERFLLSAYREILMAVPHIRHWRNAIHSRMDYSN